MSQDVLTQGSDWKRVPLGRRANLTSQACLVLAVMSPRIPEVEHVNHEPSWTIARTPLNSMIALQ